MMSDRIIEFVMAASLLLGAGGRVEAAIVFSDNFDTERLGLAISNLTNFTVVDGNGDVIGPGLFDLLPGNGRYVDLDGSLNDPGILTSRALALTTGTYQLTFDLAGSQRGDVNTVVTSVGTTANPSRFGSMTIVRNSADPFETFTIKFAVTSPINDFRFSFANGGNDNFGALLDRVVVEQLSVPEPSSLALCGVAAIVGLTYPRLRRRKSDTDSPHRPSP